MIVLMKGLDEDKFVDRVMTDFHDEAWVDRIIVIDGGSTDLTVYELKKWSKVEVYVHKWLDWYHDMEIVQSNIALSYVPHGEMCFILDFDERCSPKLKDALVQINDSGMPGGADIGHTTRETYEAMRHEDSPHAILGEDGWPVVSHQIGQFPDWQCRLIVRSPDHHWINSPHHQLSGAKKNVHIKASLIHYEKDDLRDRERIEKKWARAQARREELGLVCDAFEARVSPNVYECTKPGHWEPCELEFCSS